MKRLMFLCFSLFIPFLHLHAEDLTTWIDHPKVSASLELALKMDRELILPEVITFTAKMDRALTLERQQRLQDLGVHLKRGRDGVRTIGSSLGLRIPKGKVAHVLELPWIVELDTALPVMPTFLNEADDVQGAHEYMADWLGYELVHNTLDDNRELVRGFGVTTAVVDFNLDPFHPALFHADAGWFDWIDIDGSGDFTPGVDGIDLDGNGTIEEEEIVQLIEFPVVVQKWGGAEHNGNQLYDPYMDYLFMDVNDNGQRDIGSDANATSETPGLGEPMFVGDDANKNGILDANEKLVRLGTSKIKAIYDVANDQVFTPGNGFEEYRNSIAGGRSGEDIEFHGTYECTRVAGGHAEVEHMGGIAPGAELVFVDIQTTSSNPMNAKGDLVTAISWAHEIGAEAINYAFGEMVSKHADGSSPLEDVMATLHAEGVLQSASAGNDGSGDTHGIVEIAGGASVSIPIRVGLETRGGNSWAPGRFFVTLRWRGADKIGIQGIVAPDQTEVPGLPSSSTLIAGQAVDAFEFGSTSSRGTHLKSRVYATPSGEQLPKGTWTLLVKNSGSTSISVDIWARSEYSFPIVGLESDEMITGNQTVSYPATADDIFSVGACSVFHYDPGNHIGPDFCPFAWYSSRGPRIDGVLQVNLVSPTDLLAGYPLLKYSGGYLSFGGTSGASPHVTGTIALVLQAQRRAMLGDVRSFISGSLDKPTELGDLPNHYWGDGIMNTWEAVHPGKGRESSDKDLALSASFVEQVEAGSSFSVDVSLKNASGEKVSVGATYQIDAGYDGSFESYREGAGKVRVHAPDEVGPFMMRIRAVDGHGALWGHVITIKVVEPVVEMPDTGEEQDSLNGNDDISEGGGGSSDTSSGGCQHSPLARTSLAPLFLLAVLVVTRRRKEFR